MSRATGLKAFLCSTAVMVGTTVPSAHAQTARANADDRAQNAREDADAGDPSDPAMKDIIVTGSNIRGVRSVGSPATVIDRKMIEESGLTTASQVLRTLPQTQGSSSFSNDQPGQANPYSGSSITGGGTLFNNESRGNSVDIRGLGPNATLVLVDGRRQAPTGTVASFSEANILPLAAIERIEVVTDGASAVYGSNAIGGVINYITRKDYEGAEFSGRYSSNRLYDEWGGSLVAGHAWRLSERPGRILVSYDHNHRDRVSYDADPRIRSDLTPLGGGNAIYSNFQPPAPSGLGYYTVQACPPPRNLIFGICFSPDFSSNGFINQYYDISSLTPGGAPRGAASSGTLPANILPDTDAQRDYIGTSDTNSVNIYLNQEMTGTLDLYYQGSFSRRKESIRNYDVYSLTVSSTSPFFPLDVPPGSSSVTVPVGVSTTAEIRSRSDVHTLGAHWKFTKGWEAESYVSRAQSRNETLGRSGRPPSSDILNYLIQTGAFNPFKGLTNEARSAATYSGDIEGGSSSRAASTEVVLRANGPIATLPGGTLRGAFGLQYSDISNDYAFYTQAAQPCASLIPPATCAPLPPVLDAERSQGIGRTVRAAFAELFVPIIGAGNALPLVQKLDISLAARWEDYSDFGQTFNPRIGIVWDVADILTIRGSWGTAFRAPNLIEKSANFIGYVGPGTNNAGPQYGPVGVPTQVVILGGGNPNLGPEKSKNLTLGFDFRPVDGLRVSTTYYRIAYTDKIQALPVGTFISSPQNGLLYADFIQKVAAPNPAGCNPNDPRTWAPEVRAALPNEPRADGVCAASLILDGRWVNAAKVVQSGLDFDVRYNWSSGSNNFNAGISISKILAIREEVVLGRQTIPEPLGRIFRPLDLRGRASLGWSNGPWSVNLFGNYTPSYINDLPITPTGPDGPLPTLAVTRVKSWVTADMGIGYTVPRSGSMLSGLRLGLNIQNVTDRNPPLVLVGNQAFDARVHSLYGRTWTMQVTKAF